MLYDAYQQKINKIARGIAFFKRHAIKIAIVAALLLAVTVTLFVTIGMVGEVECKSEFIYGEEIVCDANAFLSGVRYEYRTKDGQWSKAVPVMPGEYYVRAVGKSVGGSPCYGKERSFVILERQITVSAMEDGVVYGEMPKLTADLALSDRIVCENFHYDDILLERTGVEPMLEDIRILNAEGDDVTFAYKIQTEKKQIQILPRNVTVTVNDSSKVYDGIEFNFDQYELSSGSLVEGDLLQATFTASLTEVGSVKNDPSLRILTIDGIDITHHYAIHKMVGNLTVEKRPLIVSSNSGKWEYDAYSHRDDAATVSAETPLVSDHTIVVHESTSAINAGVYDNLLRLSVMDGEGNDKSENYSVFLQTGTFEITKKDIVITTKSTEWIYDNKSHSYSTIETKGRLNGHKCYVITGTSITNCGSVTNAVTVEIYENNQRVTHNYNIIENFGVLTVKQRPITIQPLGVTQVYNDSPVSLAKYEILSDYRLAGNHQLRVNESTTLINVGSEPNCFTDFAIVDLYGNDRTENYEVTQVNGNYITVNKRSIALRPENVKEYYNADVIAPTTVTYDATTRYELCLDHTMQYTLNGSGINATNTPITTYISKIVIFNADGNDVTENYDIKLINGSLEIMKRPILIKVTDTEKIYDGTELTAYSCYKVLPVSPLLEAYPNDDQRAYISLNGSQTDVGSVKAMLAYFEVYDNAEHIYVTSNYDIRFESGTLTVLPRPIIVQSGSAQKIYDGKPLVCHDPIELVGGSLVLDHKLDMEAIGTITKVGQVPNDIVGEVLTGDNKIITYNYEVTKSPGTLTVYLNEDEQGGGGGSGNGANDLNTNMDLSNSSDSFGKEETKTVLRIKSEYSERIYLRLMSYGDIKGNTWQQAEGYPYLLDGTYSYNYLPGALFGRSNVSKATLLVQSYTTQYLLPYHLAMNGAGYDVQISDVSYKGSGMSEYSVPYYVYTGIGTEFMGMDNGYVKEELQYREFVYENYLNVDSETRTYLQKLISENQFDVNDPEIYTKVAEYIQNAATYNLEYNRDLDKSGNIVKAFLETYKEGICIHYASAATLMFRTLGVPARFVVGYMGETVADQWSEIVTPGHAWTEIYIDGVGWMPIEVTGGSFGGDGSGSGEGAGGEGGVTPILQISPAYQSKIYDGKPLVAKDILEGNTLLNELLEAGYTYTVKVEGSRTDVGLGTSEIVSFTLYDPTGKDVTSEFYVKYKSGTLEVFHNDTDVIQIYLYRLQKYYDGKPLRYGNDDYQIVSIAQNTTVEVKFFISQTNVGYLSLSDINNNIDFYITYTVWRDGVDITKNCKLICVSPDGNEDTYIPIRVDPRPIELTANSVSKVQDGTVLISDGATVTKGTLAEGDVISYVEITGNITNPGSVACSVIEDSVVILDKNGADVSSNYKITGKDGTLTIIKKQYG